MVKQGYFSQSAPAYRRAKAPPAFPLTHIKPEALRRARTSFSANGRNLI